MGNALLRVNDPGMFTWAPTLLDRRLGLFSIAALVVTCVAAGGTLRFALDGNVAIARRMLVITLLAGAGVVSLRAVELPSTARRAGLLPGRLEDVATAVAPVQAAAVAKPAARTGTSDQPQVVDGEVSSPKSMLPMAQPGPPGSVPAEVALQKPGAEGRTGSSVRRFFSLMLFVNGLHTIYLVFGLALGCWLLVATGRASTPNIALAMAAAYWTVIGALGILLIPFFYV